VGGRKVELDEIVDPSVEIPSSTTEAVPDEPSIEEEARRLMRIRVFRQAD
jgi:hypothetical protein